MSLLNNILPKKQEKEYFITLGVEEHKISAALAVIEEKEVKILGIGESEFKKEDEIEAADIAISTAEKHLPQEILVKKTIFALPATFLDKDTVKEEHLATLEKIAKELDLSPSGFVVYPEALAFYLEKKEESPPTLLLFSIGRENLTLSLVRVGKVENNIIIPRSSSISSDFEKILKSFTLEILPSRIIIYDEVKGAQLEELKEELIKLPWHKHSSFLHTPKIEILDENAVITALVEAGAGSLIKELQFAEKSKIEEREEEKKEENETFGFTTIAPPPIPIPTSPLLSISKISFPFTAFRGSSPILLILGIILLIFILLSSTIFFYPKTQVNLIVYPLLISQQGEAIFTTDANRVNTAKGIFLAKKLSEDIEGVKSIPATGKTKIGERAGGEITIYNKTVQAKLFSKGTILLTGSLKFTLDEETNIASAAETGEGLTFGKIVAKITALEIGTEGNLPAGTIFTFKDFPLTSYYAKNTAQFTGGTSREVSSVAQEDQDNLLESLSGELEKKIREKILSQLSWQEKLLEQAIKKELVNKKFSQDTGREAREVSLTLTLATEFLSFNEKDLASLVKTDLLKVPAGYLLDEKKVNIKIDEAKPDKSGSVSAKISLFVPMVPKIDTKEITARILGKSFQETSDLLSKMENIGGVKIIEEATLPFWNKKLPIRSENIQIQIVSY